MRVDLLLLKLKSYVVGKQRIFLIKIFCREIKEFRVQEEPVLHVHILLSAIYIHDRTDD